MKKLLVLVLLIATIFTITACGSSSNDDTDAQDDKKVLRVGMECGYAPYNWTQADDSNGAVPINDSSDYAYGYDVMMAKYLAEQIGYELEIYKMDFSSLPVAVQSGTIDCAIAGQSITSERMEIVDFTDPYYYASIVVLTRDNSKFADAKGLSDLQGATCTSQLGTVWYNDCLPQIADANILAANEGVPEMLVALESGTVDLLVTDMPTALAATQVYKDFRILDFTNTEDNFQVSEEEINIGISVSKDNTDLKDKLNAALKDLTVEDFEQMMNDAIAVQPLSK